jgi:hypothetical protein
MKPRNFLARQFRVDLGYLMLDRLDGALELPNAFPITREQRNCQSANLFRDLLL